MLGYGNEILSSNMYNVAFLSPHFAVLLYLIYISYSCIFRVFFLHINEHFSCIYVLNRYFFNRFSFVVVVVVVCLFYVRNFFLVYLL